MLKEESYSKIGEPPGTLTFIGENKSQDTLINITGYDEKKFFSKSMELDEFLSQTYDDELVYWIDVIGNHDKRYVSAIGEKFGINRLFLEDVMNSNQRPKFESYDECTMISIKDVCFKTDSFSLEFEHISVFVLGNIILSFRQNAVNEKFAILQKRISENIGIIRKKKSDYLLYAIIDSIMDSYLSVIDRIDDVLNEFEEKFVEKPDITMLKTIYILKRETAVLRKVFLSIRNMVRNFEQFFSSRSENQIYLRDLYDHTLQVADNLDTIREIINSMFELYLSSNGNRMNSIMKTLTIISSIFIPISFIAGFYGMNFVNMPQINDENGFFSIVLIMVIITVIMLIVFKIRKWI